MKSIFEKDYWLTEQIGKLVYRVKPHDFGKASFLNSWNLFNAEHENERRLIYSKINTSLIDCSQLHESLGFKLIDTNVEFELSGKIRHPKNPEIENIELVLAEKQYRNDVGLLAYRNFRHSRFHLDPEIDNDTANRLKQRWAENYFSGERGDDMILALLDGKLVGFLLLIVRYGHCIIDLIVVDQKAQGCGVGTAMLCFAAQEIAYSAIKAGTQTCNRSSIIFYQSMGFKMKDFTYCFHYHC